MSEQPRTPGPMFSLSPRQQTAVAAAVTILATLIIICTALGPGGGLEDASIRAV